MFNTNTLGYKLVTGKLRENRKHSEQLNKYVAGLFDADGCISAEIRTDKRGMSLRASISAASSVDQDFQMLRSLQSFYNLGTLSYNFGDSGTSQCCWYMSTKDSKIFFNLIGKHLRIKATHYQNMIWLFDNYNHILSEEDLAFIGNFRKKSRVESRWLKHPKHLSVCWLAGYADGDGNYNLRRSQNTLSLRIVSGDYHILDKLKEDFGGSIIENSVGGNYKTWRRGLGKGHITFSLPLLRKLSQYSCIERKYNKIQEMITYLESTRVATTKQVDTER